MYPDHPFQNFFFLVCMCVIKVPSVECHQFVITVCKTVTHVLGILTIEVLRLVNNSLVVEIVGYFSPVQLVNIEAQKKKFFLILQDDQTVST